MSARLRVTFLTGESVYLRAMALEDRDHAAAWFPGPFPVNAAKAEHVLRETHKSLDPPELYLAIVRAADDTVIGGVRLWSDRRAAELTFTMAPWVADADARRAEGLRLLVRWLRDEAEMMTITVTIAADEPLTIAAAEDLGMVRAGTLREWYARPGKRVDLHHYQALNPNWRVVEGADA